MLPLPEKVAFLDSFFSKFNLGIVLLLAKIERKNQEAIA